MKGQLAQLLANVGAISGSLHQPQDNELILIDEVGLPAPVVQAISRIPKGKGMAGQAWLADQPTTTCDLKNDTEAPIQAGARVVDAQSAIAIPVHGADGEIIAIVGFAFAEQFLFDELRIQHYVRLARTLFD